MKLKWIEDIKPETIKFLEEDIGKTLLNMYLGNTFGVSLLRQKKEKKNKQIEPN